MTVQLLATVGTAFIAALVGCLITAYVHLVVRTAPLGRRLVEATTARDNALLELAVVREELAAYMESVAAWQHYAQSLDTRLRDAREAINHLRGRHRHNEDQAPVEQLDVDDVTELPRVDVEEGT